MICAQVLDKLELEAEHRAVVLGSEFEVIHVTAAVNCTEKVLAARFDPLNRLADAHRDEAHQRFFRVDVELRSEAAADLGRDDAQQIFPHSENSRHQSAQQM